MHRNPTAPAPQSVRTAPIMLSIAAVKLDLASWRHRKPIDEATAVSLGDARWLASKPAEGMVDCPRCQGNGYVDFDRRLGPLRKLCPICGGACAVDAETADRVRQLMEADDLGTAEFPPEPDAEDDDATTAGPEACCSADEGTPCLPCSVAHEHPGEMDDRFAGEHAAALARLLGGVASGTASIAASGGTVAHEAEGGTDPSELRDDEGPGVYPVTCPTEADLAWYREQCRERDERLWRERIEADVPAHDQGFRAALAGDSDLYRESTNAHRRWMGEILGRCYDLAVYLEAKDGEQLLDRLDAVIDSQFPDARVRPWAETAILMGWNSLPLKC